MNKNKIRRETKTKDKDGWWQKDRSEVSVPYSFFAPCIAKGSYNGKILNYTFRVTVLPAPDSPLGMDKIHVKYTWNNVKFKKGF